MLRSFVFFVLISYSFISQAIPAGAVSASLRHGELVDILQSVKVHGRTLKDPRPLAEDVLAIELKAGHQLFVQEIRDLAEEELRAYPWGRPVRFTGRMRVLTPNGYHPIAEVRAGEAVYSWDAETQRLALNEVADVSASTRDTGYGFVTGVVRGQTIESTHDLSVASASARATRRLVGLKADAVSVRPDSCGAALDVRSGRFFGGVGRAHVYTLRLRASPHNFVLEGLVIQN